MRISIIIPAFNEQRLIGETLARVQAASAQFWQRGWETELIVCDNNSTDRTAEIARAAGATVVAEPINQIARARNTGAAAASGDWLVFIDADSHPNGGLFGLNGHYPIGGCLLGLWNWLSRGLKWLAGSFIFCDAAAFRSVGGFNNELFAAEELDLSRRFKRLARETDKRIVILHRHPLVTSARKFHLYTPREHLWFLAKTVLAGGRTLNSRQACHTWYDGRR